MSQSDKQRKRLDPEKTRLAILDAAYECFSETGFGATSIGDIAKRASVQKSLVQYHFGNKVQLWHECILGRAAPMLAAINRLLSGETTDLAELARARIEFHRMNPRIGRLLAWASLEDVPLPEQIRERTQKLRERYAESPETLRRLVLAISTIDGWFVYRPLYERILCADLDGDMDGLITEFLSKRIESK